MASSWVPRSREQGEERTCISPRRNDKHHREEAPGAPNISNSDVSHRSDVSHHRQHRPCPHPRSYRRHPQLSDSSPFPRPPYPTSSFGAPTASVLTVIARINNILDFLIQSVSVYPSIRSSTLISRLRQRRPQGSSSVFIYLGFGKQAPESNLRTSLRSSSLPHSVSGHATPRSSFQGATSCQAPRRFWEARAFMFGDNTRHRGAERSQSQLGA
jgi:hypothetical protein